MFDKIFELLDKISKLFDKKVKIFDKIQKKFDRIFIMLGNTINYDVKISNWKEQSWEKC